MTFSVYQRNFLISKVCQLCIEKPGITIAEMAKILGESKETTRRWVRMAQGDGYVTHTEKCFPGCSNLTFLFYAAGKEKPTEVSAPPKVKRPVGRPAADDLRKPPVKPFRDPLIVALFGPARAEVQACKEVA